MGYQGPHKYDMKAQNSKLDRKKYKSSSHHLIFFFVFFLCLFRATPTAYGGSQARGLIELQLPASTRATAMPDPSRIYNLHHSSLQHPILNPLNEARDRTHNIMVPSQICFCSITMGTPSHHS